MGHHYKKMNLLRQRVKALEDENQQLKSQLKKELGKVYENL
ncbi:transposase C [Bacillus cereus B4264]|uniref:Transposase C n=1 Tax=Bacillus cereus (strain B4264) TaxID=405532 RepID=B7H5V4_BACC4|nr:transposase C [Bacillus cereus B4264]